MYRAIATAVTNLQQGIFYATFIALLALASLALLGFELWYGAVYPHLVPLTTQLDLAIAWIFLTDFFLGLMFNRVETMRSYWRHNWLNLVSSIPISAEAARALRILRIFRALRVIRAAVNFWFARQRLRRNRR